MLFPIHRARMPLTHATWPCPTDTSSHPRLAEPILDDIPDGEARLARSGVAGRSGRIGEKQQKVPATISLSLGLPTQSA